MKTTVNTPKGVMKPCNGPLCNGKLRPLGSFYRDASTFCGYKSRCRFCCRHKAVERWRSDPEKHRAVNKAWREAVKERKYASAGPEDCAA